MRLALLLCLGLMACGREITAPRPCTSAWATDSLIITHVLPTDTLTATAYACNGITLDAR